MAETWVPTSKRPLGIVTYLASLRDRLIQVHELTVRRDMQRMDTLRRLVELRQRNA